jgi:hypothetical protein
MDPPGPYPLGTTTVTVTATDDSGATDTCTATVTVVDGPATPPEIGCAVDVTRKHEECGDKRQMTSVRGLVVTVLWQETFIYLRPVQVP